MNTVVGFGMKTGRQVEYCFEARETLVRFGHVVIRHRPVSQARSGYQAVAAPLLSDLSLQTITPSWLSGMKP